MRVLFLLLVFENSLSFSLPLLPIVNPSQCQRTPPSMTTSSWTVPTAGLVLDSTTPLPVLEVHVPSKERHISNDKCQLQQPTQPQQQHRSRSLDESAVNVTLPLALTILAPELFPSLSKARRSIRQKRILVGNTVLPEVVDAVQVPESVATPPRGTYLQYSKYASSDNNATTFVSFVGTSATRIYPGTIISYFPKKSQLPILVDFFNNTRSTSPGQQEQPNSAVVTRGYPNLSYSKVNSLLPEVIYQDDDVAVLNKLAGMISHSIDKGGYSSNSILKMAPLVLTPPQENRTRTKRMHTSIGITIDDYSKDGTTLPTMQSQFLTTEKEQDDNDENYDGIADNDILAFPALVHRLDTQTSGLLIMAKTKTASISLSQQFVDRKVRKTYHAIVYGKPLLMEGILKSDIVTTQAAVTRSRTVVDKLNNPYNDEEGDHHLSKKVGITKYKVLQSIPTTHQEGGRTRTSFRSWIEFQPLTGRRHQLRQHAAYDLQCPIVGDPLYGNDELLLLNQDGYDGDDSDTPKRTRTAGTKSKGSSYMYLCSTQIAFYHPRTKEWLNVTIPPPKRFDNYWKREKNRYEKYQQWVLSQPKKQRN